MSQKTEARLKNLFYYRKDLDIAYKLCDYCNKIQTNIDMKYEVQNIYTDYDPILKYTLKLDNGEPIIFTSKNKQTSFFSKIASDFYIEIISNIINDPNHKDNKYITDMLKNNVSYFKEKDYDKINYFFAGTNLIDKMYNKASYLYKNSFSDKSYLEKKEKLALDTLQSKVEKFVNGIKNEFKDLNYTEEQIESMLMKSIDRIKIYKILS